MMNEEQISRLTKAQNAIVKALDIKSVIPVKSLIKLELCKFMYKYSNEKLSKPIINAFDKNSHR